MSYMVISTIQGLTKNLDEELKVACSSDNSDGHKIKVIIGSTVAAEGMDFKNVRAVHVLEPWRHINKIEQVIGRGVRNCSHKDLLPEQRNVTIYLHNMMVGPSNGSFDTYLYRYCEDKAMEIGKITEKLHGMKLTGKNFLEMQTRRCLGLFLHTIRLVKIMIG